MMHNPRWKPFWAALGAALMVLLPLAGGTVLLTRQTLHRQLQAAQPQSGVAVPLPKTEHQLTLLVCTTGEAPGFTLLYLNAPQNCIHLLTLPQETTVTFGGRETSLAACYSAAGPARCREALQDVLSLPESTRYLALSPAVLAAVTDRYGMLRVGFSGALTAQELARTNWPGGVQALSSREAQQFLALLTAQSVLPEHRAAAQATVWDAFFRQNLELLPTTLAQALREHSSSLLTDLTAQDLLLLEQTLEFLANGNAAVRSAALPGQWEPADGCYHATAASRAAMQTFFNVSPATPQSASASEP